MVLPNVYFQYMLLSNAYTQDQRYRKGRPQWLRLRSRGLYAQLFHFTNYNHVKNPCSGTMVVEQRWMLQNSTQERARSQLHVRLTWIFIRTSFHPKVLSSLPGSDGILQPQI